MNDITLYCGDCFELLEQVPDGSVDLALTDPPYGIHVQYTIGGKKYKCEWDNIDGYTQWTMRWLRIVREKLRDNGVMYFFHNNMETIADLLYCIRNGSGLDFTLLSFITWEKPNVSSIGWKNRKPKSQTAPRVWFNTCEYILHFVKTAGDKTGLEQIYSNPECFKPIKDWYKGELKRLGITRKDIERKYEEATGRKPYMVSRHYFTDSQFEIPVQDVWEQVYEPLGFSKTYKELHREYEQLRREYEQLRREYEQLRYYHKADREHSNVWRYPIVPANKRLHPTQKPVELLERIIAVSCPPGGVVLDPFMGSGSTGAAARNTGRKFIGIECNRGYFAAAQSRLLHG